jgi:hypothetical protein
MSKVLHGHDAVTAANRHPYRVTLRKYADDMDPECELDTVLDYNLIREILADDPDLLFCIEPADLEDM